MTEMINPVPCKAQSAAALPAYRSSARGDSAETATERGNLRANQGKCAPRLHPSRTARSVAIFATLTGSDASTRQRPRRRPQEVPTLRPARERPSSMTARVEVMARSCRALQGLNERAKPPKPRASGTPDEASLDEMRAWSAH